MAFVEIGDGAQMPFGSGLVCASSTVVQCAQQLYMYECCVTPQYILPCLEGAGASFFCLPVICMDWVIVHVLLT